MMRKASVPNGFGGTHSRIHDATKPIPTKSGGEITTGVLLGRSWGPLGGLLGSPRDFLVLLGASWRTLGVLLGLLGSLLGCSGGILGLLSSLLQPLGPSWGLLGRPPVALAASWGALGLLLECSWSFLGCS
jgi:hypothetical protein